MPEEVNITVDESVEEVNIVVSESTSSDYTVTESDVTQHQSSLTITEAQISDLSHFSGSYNDLTDTPNIPEDNYISNISISGNSISITGVGNGFDGSIELPNQNNSSPILSVVKTQTENRANDDVLRLDNELHFELEGNSSYMINVRVRYSSQGSPDFQYQLEVPSGATGAWYSDADSLNAGSKDLIDIQFLNGFGSSIMNIPFQVFIKTIEGGTFGFKWAQNTASVGSTSVLELSNIIATKLN